MAAGQVTLADIMKEMKAKYASPVTKTKRDAKDYGHMKPVKALATNAAVGAKMLMFKTEVMSSSGDIPYQCFIQFKGVEYTQDPPKGDVSFVPVQIIDKEEETGKALWWYKKPSMLKTPVMIKCTCSDFRFRWSKYLFDVKALIGNWQRYEKVPGSTHPSVNPNQSLGVCKHLYSMAEALKNSGVVDP